MLKKLNNEHNSSGYLLIRFLVGFVFLSEGIQKILFPALLGSGRFIKLAVPFPYFFGPLVGTIEIICGLLVIIGLFTRYAAFPLLIIILFAVYFTKVPSFIHKGFWVTLHDGRADYCMLLGLLFLLICGAGKYSVDHYLSQNGKNKS